MVGDLIGWLGPLGADLFVVGALALYGLAGYVIGRGRP